MRRRRTTPRREVSVVNTRDSNDTLGNRERKVLQHGLMESPLVRHYYRQQLDKLACILRTEDTLIIIISVTARTNQLDQ